MKTKLFTLFLALAASIGTLFGFSGTCGDNLTWDLTDGVLKISGTGDMTNWFYYVDVPWYSNRESITSVTIVNSVISIGDYAFWECSSLTGVTIPKSVTSIGGWAFWGCSSLTRVTIPNSVKSIGENAFYDCSGLTSIVVENGNTVYDSRNNCNAIIETTTNTLVLGCMNTTIPNSITSIGGWAFDGCSGLTSIEIPNSVTSIENSAFRACSGLTSVTIPNSVTSIGSDAFEYCANLTSVTIGNSVTSIGASAFSGCSSLTSIEIPNSVTSIGLDAFSMCSSLTSVTISNSVTSIGGGAFSGCSGLTSVTIPNSVTSIGGAAFSGCCGLTSVVIPNSVTNIGDVAFADCTGLTSITCNSVVPPICGVSAFYEVNKSIPIYVPGNSVEAYKEAEVWKEFGENIQPIKASDVDVTNVVVEPTDNSAVVQWPTVTSAYTYELIIKDKSGNVVCTLIFNAQGQLTSIAFNAPGRNAPQQTQTAGFAYTITGLDSGTSYNLTIVAKNSSGNVLDKQEKSFTTTGVITAIDSVNSSAKLDGLTKFIKNGQLLILRGDELFNAQGARVK